MEWGGKRLPVLYNVLLVLIFVSLHNDDLEA